jgi:hypothetical protein
MDPYFQAIIIAQYQRELQAEAAERRRTARIKHPGRFRTSLTQLLVSARTALQKGSNENVGESKTIARVQAKSATPASECVPRCLRLEGVAAHQIAHAHGTVFHGRDR